MLKSSRLLLVLVVFSLWPHLALSSIDPPNYLCYSDSKLEMMFSFYNKPEESGGSYMSSNLGGREFDLDVFGQIEHGQDALLVHADDKAQFALCASYQEETGKWTAVMSYPRVNTEYPVGTAHIPLTCEDYTDELFYRLVELGY